MDQAWHGHWGDVGDIKNMKQDVREREKLSVDVARGET